MSASVVMEKRALGRAHLVLPRKGPARRPTDERGARRERLLRQLLDAVDRATLPLGCQPASGSATSPLVPPPSPTLGPLTALGPAPGCPSRPRADVRNSGRNVPLAVPLSSRIRAMLVHCKTVTIFRCMELFCRSAFPGPAPTRFT